MTAPPVSQSHIVVYEGGDIISDGGGDCEDKEPHQVTIAAVTMRQCDDCGADPQIGGAAAGDCDLNNGCVTQPAPEQHLYRVMVAAASFCWDNVVCTHIYEF